MPRTPKPIYTIEPTPSAYMIHSDQGGTWTVRVDRCVACANYHLFPQSSATPVDAELALICWLDGQRPAWRHGK